MFTTDEDLMTAVAAALHKHSLTVTVDAPFWTRIITRSNRRAYNEIVRRLAQRGYTMTQISAWDEGIDFQTDLGCFWALTSGGVTYGEGSTSFKLYDRREELPEVLLTTNGVPVYPGDPMQQITIGERQTGHEHHDGDWPDDRF